MKIKWKTIAPLVVWLVIYLLPIPSGLNANQWHYFAVFAAVITGLVLESMPVGAVGLIGLTFAAVMGYVESDPTKSLRWALSWIRGEYRLAHRRGVHVRDRLSQERTGQSHRSTAGTGLGPSNTRQADAVTFADLILAPATPSNTARSGSAIHPIVNQHSEALRLRAWTHFRRDRHLCDVDRFRGHRRHQFNVSHRACAQRHRAYHRQENRGRGHGS